MAAENEGPTFEEDLAKSDEKKPDDADVSTRPGWREVFRQAFDKAIRQQQPANRRELGQDRSRSLFLLGGAIIAALLLFFGVFSSSTTKKGHDGRRTDGTPDLGRRITPGRQHDGQAPSVTPVLNAESRQPAAAEQYVTPEEVGRTAQPGQSLPVSQPATKLAGSSTGPYALGRIEFANPVPQPEAHGLSALPTEAASDDLRKPSLVFVRNTQSNTAVPNEKRGSDETEEVDMDANLPAGTRLLVRLLSVVNSAIKAPVVAAVEYNYEKDGEIVVPAGAQVLGDLQQADRSGYVAIRFNAIHMPDGSEKKITATAASLALGPLKGVVSGKRTGTNFLVRTLSGLGQAATYVVGSNGLNAPLSQGALLRDQIATNIGIAGDQQLSNLAITGNVIVTVPANTRFYIVIETAAAPPQEKASAAEMRTAGNPPVPTAQALRQLMQLQRELNELYQQGNGQNAAQQTAQQ